MKETLLFAASAIVLLASCTKESPRQAASHEEAVPTELTIDISSEKTRSTTVTPENEVKSNKLQVLVFRGNELDAYGTADNATELTLSCTAGDREVYALVNVPDLKDVATKTDLLAKVSQFSGNTLTNFEMIGSRSVTLPQTNTVSIDVKRLAARVTISKINRNFTSPALAAQTFTIDKVYLLNVAKDINYGLTQKQPSGWFNLGSYKDEAAELTYDAPASQVANASAYATKHMFYCYPNDATSQVTRLVIETTLGKNKYYYPIDLPAISPNHSYDISEVTITRPGSDDPNKPVSFEDLKVSINVVDWVAVPVTEGTVI